MSMRKRERKEREKEEREKREREKERKREREKERKREKNREIVTRKTGFTKFWKFGNDDVVVSFENTKLRNIFWICRGSSVDFFFFQKYDRRTRANNHAAKLA